jgi:hypothetical protein
MAGTPPSTLLLIFVLLPTDDVFNSTADAGHIRQGNHL